MFLLLGLHIEQMYQARPGQKVGLICALYNYGDITTGRTVGTHNGCKDICKTMRSYG